VISVARTAIGFCLHILLLWFIWCPEHGMLVPLIPECAFCWFGSSGILVVPKTWHVGASVFFSECIKGRNMFLYLQNMGCCFVKRREREGAIAGCKLFHVQPLVASCDALWICDFCSDL
jgi:hypothetical protein